MIDELAGRGFARSPFPAIADYGFLSDCEATALVAPSGAVEWMCLPRMDSPSVFGALLDRDAGMFRLGPAGVHVPAARRYLPGTMILETSWDIRGGWIIVRDVLLFGPWHHEHDRSNTHRRAPTDYDADHVLLRTVRCVNGEVQLSLVCEPVFDYGRVRGRWEYAGDDYHEVVVKPEGSEVELRLTSDLNLGIEGPRATVRHMMKEGEQRVLRAVVERAPRAADGRRGVRPAGLDRPSLAALARPRRLPRPPVAVGPAAQRADAQGAHLRADRRDHRRRHDVAAGDARRRAQLGLPLHLDPRRDVRALGPVHARLRLGGQRLLLLRRRRRRGRRGPAADHVRDRRRAALPEQTLDHLSGYENARPVRIGNGAHDQQQHDVWGAVLDSVYLHTKSRDHLPERVWPILVTQVEAALANWRGPDRGIWEVRGEPKHFTSSKIMCWVALDRGARLAELREDWDRAMRWRSVADEIHADICEHAVDERGVFTQHYETTALDASVLLMPLVALPARRTTRASAPPCSRSPTS